MGVKKVPRDLVPMVALVYEAIAYLKGETRYGAVNWRRTAVRRRFYLAAILRHALVRVWQAPRREVGHDHRCIAGVPTHGADAPRKPWQACRWWSISLGA